MEDGDVSHVFLVPLEALCVFRFFERHDSLLYVRLVGGCVRDICLGHLPKDFDFATSILPEIILSWCQDESLPTVLTGFSHGTVKVKLSNQWFEITTLREDIVTDGRHAQVSFGLSWKKDALRRDFTLNALYMDAASCVYDYVDGINDLQCGYVRFIGDAQTRIKEDALRLLRYFRFCTFYAKQPYNEQSKNRKELEACRVMAHSLCGLSRERKYNELLKLFSVSANRFQNLLDSLDNMSNNSVLSYLLPISHYPSTRKCLIEIERILNDFDIVSYILKQEEKYNYPSNCLSLLRVMALVEKKNIDLFLHLYPIKKKEKNFIYDVLAMNANVQKNVQKHDFLLNPHFLQDIFWYKKALYVLKGVQRVQRRLLYFIFNNNNDEVLSIIHLIQKHIVNVNCDFEIPVFPLDRNDIFHIKLATMDDEEKMDEAVALSNVKATLTGEVFGSYKLYLERLWMKENFLIRNCSDFVFCIKDQKTA